MRPNAGNTERSQPNTKSHNERAAAGGERDRQSGDSHSKKADEPAQENAGADEDHVGCAARPVCITDHGHGAIDIAFGAQQAQQVAAFNLRRQGNGHLLSGARELAQKDAAKLRSPGLRLDEFLHRFAVESLVRHHHVQNSDGKIE